MPIKTGDIVEFQSPAEYLRCTALLHKAKGGTLVGSDDDGKAGRRYVVVAVRENGLPKRCPPLVFLIPFSTSRQLYLVDGVPSYSIKAGELGTDPDFPTSADSVVVVGLCCAAPLDSVKAFWSHTDPAVAEMIAPVSLVNRLKFAKLLEFVTAFWPSRLDAIADDYAARFHRETASTPGSAT